MLGMILCSAGTALSLYGIVYFVHRFGAAWMMRRWRQTMGRVVKAEMQRGRRKTSEGCRLFDPVLRYTYNVGGRTYECDRFTHQLIKNVAFRLAIFIGRHNPGTEVPVYYHPRNPELAVLQPMPWQGAATGMMFCSLIFVAMLACILG